MMHFGGALVRDLLAPLLALRSTPYSRSALHTLAPVAPALCARF